MKTYNYLVIPRNGNILWECGNSVPVTSPNKKLSKLKPYNENIKYISQLLQFSTHIHIDVRQSLP